MNTMKKSGIFNIYFISVILSFGVTSISFAAPQSDHGDKSHAGAMQGGHHNAQMPNKKNKHKKGGTFSPHWAKTLTSAQKTSFDKMHLVVGQFEAVQRAKIKMLKAELNVLAANKSSNKSAIYGKIDEILAVKKGIMRSRFDHIAEMRNELTDQQRISYDMGLLKRGKHKH
ncbi:MAG: hypothetical protein OEM38_07740 [Gammaproteobacteria bacterium]|nr:hypothetical protein [Gammaproteobacteria bacterium]